MKGTTVRKRNERENTGKRFFVVSLKHKNKGHGKTHNFYAHNTDTKHNKPKQHTHLPLGTAPVGIQLPGSEVLGCFQGKESQLPGKEFES